MRKGCITSRKNLTNFLLNLEEYNYIKRDKRNSRWKLTSDFHDEYKKQMTIAEILDNLYKLPDKDLKIIQNQIRKFKEAKSFKKIT